MQIAQNRSRKYNLLKTQSAARREKDHLGANRSPSQGPGMQGYVPCTLRDLSDRGLLHTELSNERWPQFVV